MKTPKTTTAKKSNDIKHISLIELMFKNVIMFLKTLCAFETTTAQKSDKIIDFIPNKNHFDIKLQSVIINNDYTIIDDNNLKSIIDKIKLLKNTDFKITMLFYDLIELKTPHVFFINFLNNYKIVQKIPYLIQFDISQKNNTKSSNFLTKFYDFDLLKLDDLNKINDLSDILLMHYFEKFDLKNLYLMSSKKF